MAYILITFVVIRKWPSDDYVTWPTSLIRINYYILYLTHGSEAPYPKRNHDVIKKVYRKPPNISPGLI